MKILLLDRRRINILYVMSFSVFCVMMFLIVNGYLKVSVDHLLATLGIYITFLQILMDKKRELFYDHLMTLLHDLTGVQMAVLRAIKKKTAKQEEVIKDITTSLADITPSECFQAITELRIAGYIKLNSDDRLELATKGHIVTTRERVF